MKFILKSTFTLVSALFALNVFAQWNGPSSGFMYTGNSVRVEKQAGLTGTVGNPMPPVFEAKLTGSGLPTENLFHIAYSGRIGIGTETPLATLHIANSGNFKITRTNNTSICSIDNMGKFVLTTDGVNNQYRGFFINNGSTDFFKVTQRELSYSNVFTLDNKLTMSGDILIKDNNGDIQLRAFTDGTLWAREVHINLTNIPPDYVFEKSYKLLSLQDVEKYITQYKHLPNVPSAQEMTEKGNININEMQFKLLEKVEELTLYMIELKKENVELRNRLEAIESQK